MEENRPFFPPLKDIFTRKSTGVNKLMMAEFPVAASVSGPCF